MLRTVFNSSLLAVMLLALTGCGLFQRVEDGSKSVANWVFYKQVKTLRLDFTGRAAMNTDSHDMSGLSVPTLVRVYQLKDAKAFEQASYEALLADSGAVLGDGLLDERAVVVRPEEGAQLSVPMDKDAQVVGVVALVRQPDATRNSWRLVLTREELDPDRARTIELADNFLALQPLPAKE